MSALRCRVVSETRGNVAESKVEESGMPRAKGLPKTGGREKGTPNKLTRAFREAVLTVYQNLGGDKQFLAWAKRNQTGYYKIAARMIPTEVTGKDGGPIETHNVGDLPPATRGFLEILPAREVIAAARCLCRTDLYFLLRYGCERDDVEHEWIFDRCREVQSAPNGYLDLWARDHYKSSVITFAKTLQDVLSSHGDDPLAVWQGQEVTLGIFSHTRPIAKGFLRQIRRELETNERLKEWFPDVLWRDPQKEAPKWSEDDGIVIKRKGNPKESTIEAWGMVDGQPIGKHFLVMVYDDVVTRESVNTPEMIKKTTEALELSYALGADGGVRRFIGTRYHFNDSYRTIMDRGTAKPRVYPATDDGTVNGVGVLYDAETIAEKRRDMGPFTFSAQLLLNPIADGVQGFKRDWLRHYGDIKGSLGMNNYMLVDPATARKRDSDYTAIFVVGLHSDENYYVLDIVRDRLSLTERAEAVMRLHRKWKPLEVRYEQYGLMADTEYLRERMDRENYRFNLKEVGGQTAKVDRIRRLIPLFETGRVFLPEALTMVDREGRARDLVREFIEEEYAAFPVGLHDDMLDAFARIVDPDLPLSWPRERVKKAHVPWHDKLRNSRRSAQSA